MTADDVVVMYAILEPDKAGCRRGLALAARSGGPQPHCRSDCGARPAPWCDAAVRLSNRQTRPSRPSRPPTWPHITVQAGVEKTRGIKESAAGGASFVFTRQPRRVTPPPRPAPRWPADRGSGPRRALSRHLPPPRGLPRPGHGLAVTDTRGTSIGPPLAPCMPPARILVPR